MGLNETLDRLKREYETKELKEADQMIERQPAAAKRDIIREYAERIFFDRMLKDINHGMSAPKIEAMIDRSIMIAQMLHKKLGD